MKYTQCFLNSARKRMQRALKSVRFMYMCTHTSVINIQNRLFFHLLATVFCSFVLCLIKHHISTGILWRLNLSCCHILYSRLSHSLLHNHLIFLLSQFPMFPPLPPSFPIPLATHCLPSIVLTSLFTSPPFLNFTFLVYAHQRPELRSLNIWVSG